MLTHHGSAYQEKDIIAGIISCGAASAHVRRLRKPLLSGLGQTRAHARLLYHEAD
jgi:hypothetical protein